MMTLVVKDLSDQDIADLAAYYGAIEISASATEVSPRHSALLSCRGEAAKM